MCTVSFLPLKDKVLITSNRDEKAWRLPAQAPVFYEGTSCDLIYPKDGDAGGSWITLCSNGNAGVLLNGAFERHQRKATYRKSRGLQFLEIMDSRWPLHTFVKTALNGIEPFTMVIWQEGNLYECRWDAGEKKHIKALKNYRPYIWSSVTLYDEAVRRKREQWFPKWLNAHPTPTRSAVLRFHHFGGEGDKENDLLMNRDGKVFTVSITNIEISGRNGSLSYSDVLSGETTYQQIHFSHNRMLV